MTEQWLSTRVRLQRCEVIHNMVHPLLPSSVFVLLLRLIRHKASFKMVVLVLSGSKEPILCTHTSTSLLPTPAFSPGIQQSLMLQGWEPQIDDWELWREGPTPWFLSVLATGDIASSDSL